MLLILGRFLPGSTSLAAVWISCPVSVRLLFRRMSLTASEEMRSKRSWVKESRMFIALPDSAHWSSWCTVFSTLWM